MFHQNPYEPNCTSHLQDNVEAQTPLLGVTKALVLWGGSFTVTAALLLLIRCYPKLPDPQPLSFLVTCGAIFVIGSMLFWGFGLVADTVGPKRSVISQIAITTLFVLMAVPGMISLQHYGFGWNAMNKALIFLIPTMVYTSSRTKRWTRRARSTGFDLR